MKKKRKLKTAVSVAKATEVQLCRVRRDHIYVGDWSIMTDSYTVWVTFAEKESSLGQSVEVPRDTFNKLIRWYLRPQKFIRKAP